MNKACPRPRSGGRALDPSGGWRGRRRPFAQQALRFVGIKVVARLGEEVADPLDFIGLFGKWVCIRQSGCSRHNCPSAMSCSGLEVGEKRGVMT